VSKGGSFENEIARQLSLWFTDGQRDEVFGRSDGSGSRFTSRWKKGKNTVNQHGDIAAMDSIGEPLIKIWSIEAKTGYSSKKVVKDADGDVVKIPIYAKRKIKDKNEERIITGWKSKKAIVPWGVLDFIDGQRKNQVLQLMWDQCTKDAKLSLCEPILIFRRNGRPACICFQRSYYLSLGKYYGKYPSNLVALTIGEENLVIILLKGFFEWAQPVCKFLSERK
jgi:hypothetical protein